MVCDLYLRMWLKEAPREQVGLNRPRDCARVVASLACPQPCSPQRPDGGGTSRLDVSPSRQEATCGEQGCSQLSSPGLFTGESPGDRSNCLEQFRAPCQSLPRWRALLQGAPLLQGAAGIVLPPCLSEPPQVGPGPGWGVRVGTGLLILWLLP